MLNYVIHDPRKVRCYVMGFSKGGFAAFQLAKKLGARAIVTIDASDLNRRSEVMKTIKELTIPFWVIYTRHDEDGFRTRISEFHEEIVKVTNAERWDGIHSPPKNRQRVVTCIDLPSFPSGGYRHEAVAKVVSLATSPFEYLLSHAAVRRP